VLDGRVPLEETRHRVVAFQMHGYFLGTVDERAVDRAGATS
jgi:hypothetical protein